MTRELWLDLKKELRMSPLLPADLIFGLPSMTSHQGNRKYGVTVEYEDWTRRYPELQSESRLDAVRQGGTQRLRSGIGCLARILEHGMTSGENGEPISINGNTHSRYMI